jgi:hypothetical protein
MSKQKKSGMKWKSPWVIALAFGLLFTIMFGSRSLSQNKADGIKSFNDCVKAGNPSSQEHPMTCRTPDGLTFTEKLESVDAPYAQENTVRGRVTKIDYSAAATGGEVPIEIETDDKIRSGYYLGTDASVCDMSLVLNIKNREFKIGDRVEIRSRLSGLKASDGQAVDSISFQRVCDEGTFIKKFDPEAYSGDNSFRSEWFTVQGNITSVDLEPMKRNDGSSGTIKIRTSNGESYYVTVGSTKYLDGPSLCDRPALPSTLDKNTPVEVRGELGSHPDGSKELTVCAKETYVRIY